MTETIMKNIVVKSGDQEKRLLVVVDGDSTHLYYTSILLQRLDYMIHAAKTAEDALEIMSVARPVLILTEISFGRMDGLELLKKIKSNPQSFPVPVVMLTSSKDQTVKAACLQVGCAAYLQKPVEPDALYTAIQRATESQPRQYPRLSTALNVIIGDDKTAEYTWSGDYITALSEKGMYISTLKPKPIGLQIPITLLLEDRQIKIEGIVLYSFQRGEGPLKTPGMGIQFVRIRLEDQDVIKTYIKREITKGI
jgi:CheY-like chemotaxis protein